MTDEAYQTLVNDLIRRLKLGRLTTDEYLAARAELRDAKILADMRAEMRPT